MAYRLLLLFTLIVYTVGEDSLAGKKVDPDGRDLKETKPYFIKSNHDLNCTPSNFVELNCEAGGYPLPNITWYKKRERINDSKGPQERKWTLMLNLSNTSSYGDFMCHICNKFDCINHTYVIDSTTCDKSIIEDDETDDSVTMQESEKPHAPYFVNKKMTKIHVKPAGHVITFRCKAGGYPIPNITWYKNDDKPVRSLGDVKYNNWNLQLQDLVITDAANYTCKVCNYLGCIHFTYSLDVIGTRLLPLFSDRDKYIVIIQKDSLPNPTLKTGILKTSQL
ncbi:Immunoglobulin [Oryctes borbonicus]|uniref:Immunoglobulin n=1 Tax=Oryctes borbonicus TaxID=1629725 RepID=A0A0T6B2C9_9SCAR|nr:Immunoglobulin [Oryctes borbonicus]